MSTVDIVLIQDVPKLGKIGDVRRVAGGFARNYLLPNGLALAASQRRLGDRGFQAELNTRRADAERAQAESKASLIQGANVVIRATLGAQGRMHGQITNQDVAQALLDQHGVEVDRHTIQIDSPIRSLGRYLLPIRVASGVEASITLEVSEPVEESPEPEDGAGDAEAAT